MLLGDTPEPKKNVEDDLDRCRSFFSNNFTLNTPDIESKKDIDLDVLSDIMEETSIQNTNKSRVTSFNSEMTPIII